MPPRPLRFALASSLLLGATVLACGGAPARAAPAPIASAPPPAPAPPPDPLGARPTPATSPPFHPETPEVLAGPAGSKVWLFARHNLPLVSVGVVVPYGSAAEPAGEPGLAYVTADMLDEGAGKKDAIAFSAALSDLGAKLSSFADRDVSMVSLQVLAPRLGEALPLLADAIQRPRNDGKDFARVSELWQNALKARAQDPNEVARIVTAASFYGLDHPYGRPFDGTPKTAAKIKLPRVAAWHQTIWRPDVATFVVVGDVTKDEVGKLLEKAFAGWKAPKAAAPAIPDPPAPAAGGIRTVWVERPDAPQVVMSIARAGVSSKSDDYARLSMLNVALGGSFTSRLNQDLREDHGWTYGARTRFNLQRGVGMFVARASIRTDAISPALAETMKVITATGKEGLSEGELAKVRAQTQADAIEAYGSIRSIGAALGTYSGLGLAPDYDAKVLASQVSATLPELSALGQKYLSLDSATIVLVGPKQAIAKAFADNQLPAPEQRDAEGNPVKP